MPEETNTDPAPDPQPAADPKPAKPGKPAEKPAPPKKLELSEDELQSRIDAALAAERKKHESKAQREREEADAKAAKEQGKWQEIAQKAEARVAELEAKDRRQAVKDRVGDYLREHHAEYAGTERYILPLVLEQVDAETAPEDLTKAVKAVAEQYVKDNPRQAAGRAGTPAAPAGRQAAAPRKPEPGANGSGGRIKFTGAAAKF